jgi:TIR domain-containing protein
MLNIFISYNRQSEAIVQTLANDIKELGHKGWWDQELSGGQTWWNQILAQIRACDLFVFVLDREALNSIACKREADYAGDLGKPILPILVTEEASVNLLPPALGQIQFVDYRKPDRTTALRLARALTTIPPAAPLPDPLPTPPAVPLSYLGGLYERIETLSELSYEEQSSLVVNLKRSWRDPKTSQDTQILLGRLRTRRDLFATIAAEIDEVLESTRPVAAAPPEVVAMDPSASKRLLDTKPRVRPTRPLSNSTKWRIGISVILCGLVIIFMIALQPSNTSQPSYTSKPSYTSQPSSQFSRDLIDQIPQGIWGANYKAPQKKPDR